MNDDEKIKNLAFIDGQNLYMGTAKHETNPWKIDLAKFRVYLKKKYNVDKAYYFLGFMQDRNQEIYEEIQNAGYILKFREHNSIMIGKKKGNVDSDIIFHIMKKMYRKESFERIILVSGDGDYKSTVDFLIKEKRFLKVLFPNRNRASSLYKKLSNKYFTYLDNIDIRNKVDKKEKGALGS